MGFMMTNAITWMGVSSHTTAGMNLLLESAVKGMVVLSLGGILAALLYRESAALRHLIWSASLGALLLIPLVSLTMPKWRVLPLRGPLMPAPAVRVESRRTQPQFVEHADSKLRLESAAKTIAEEQGHVMTGRTHSSPEMRREAKVAGASGDSTVCHNKLAKVNAWAFWSCSIWATVSILLLLRMVMSRLILSRVVRRASAIKGGGLRKALESAGEQLSIKRRIHLYVSSDRNLPMTWGIFRICILLPSDCTLWASEQIRSVLLHELAHVKRYDTITHVVGQVACSVYWFNPLAWFAARRCEIEREWACDDLVVQYGIAASDYAEHLLSIVSCSESRHDAPAAALAMARRSRLEGRVLAILNDKLNRKPLTVKVVTLASTVGLAAALGIGILRAADPGDGVNNGSTAANARKADSATADAMKRNDAKGTKAARESVLLGEVVERTVNDDIPAAGGYFIDFETGRLFSLPEEFMTEERDRREELDAWIIAKGIDAVGDTQAPLEGLLGIDMVVLPIPGPADRVPNVTSAQFAERLAGAKPGRPVPISGRGKLPATYLFETRDRTQGILQIVGFAEDPSGVRIRYKLISRQGGDSTNGRSVALPDAETKNEDPLQGVWVAESMEADGTAVPENAIKRLRFTFENDKLFIRGNHDDDREEECKYQVDPNQSPKHLSFTTPDEDKPILAIYELKGDELKVCVRQSSSSKGRPSRFATKAESQLVLIVFKRLKPLSEQKVETTNGRSLILPDTDTKNAEVVLDLSSGDLLNPPNEGDLLAMSGLGKGDLAFNRVLACLRGATAMQWDGEHFVRIPPKDRVQDATAYELPQLPCRLLVTTAEKERFDVTIISRISQTAKRGGIRLKYQLADPGAVPK